MQIARIVLCTLVLGLAQASLAGPSEDFEALLDEAWEWQLKENPMMASGLGDRRYNDQWTDNSIQAIKRRQDETREFLRRAYAIDRTALSEDDQLNYELFRRSLQDRVDLFKFDSHLIPFYQRGGVQNLDSNTSRLRFVTVKDYEDWIARLGQIDVVIDQSIDLAEAGRKAGMMSPKILMERIPNQISAQLVDDPEESPFFKVFAEMPSTISDDDQARLRAQARSVIEETVLPAYRELNEYFVDTYLPNSRDTIGLSELPNGNEWYELRARQFTTTQMTPDEIHRIGLDEVARIRGEMQKIIDSLDFGGSFNDFLIYLRTDPQFYFDNPEDLYQAYLATSKRIDPELVNLFGHCLACRKAKNRFPIQLRPIRRPPTTRGQRRMAAALAPTGSTCTNPRCARSMRSRYCRCTRQCRDITCSLLCNRNSATCRTSAASWALPRSSRAGDSIAKASAPTLDSIKTRIPSSARSRTKCGVQYASSSTPGCITRDGHASSRSISSKTMQRKLNSTSSMRSTVTLAGRARRLPTKSAS